MSSVFRHHRSIIAAVLAVVVASFSYVVWYQTKSSFVSLLDADIDTLKGVFFGEQPFLYYCHERGNTAYVPPKLLDAHKIMGHKYGLAILNCSQELPSGKNIFSRFNLKKDWKPTIFATAPWAKPSQVPPLSLKHATTMANFLVSSLEPRALKASTDAEYKDACGFSSKSSSSKPPACILIMKGGRYTEAQDAVVATIVETYHTTRVVSVDTAVRRLSIERSEVGATNPQNYAMRVHVVGSNGTRYVSMQESPTWTNIQRFLSTALVVGTHTWICFI